MKIVYPSCEFIQSPPTNTLQIIERAGRVCYKSEDRITPESAAKFVKSIMFRGHESVIEHVVASMLFVTDRGVTHELVRHRIASYSQESTRFCNYSKEKFSCGTSRGQVSFCLPVRFDPLRPFIIEDGFLKDEKDIDQSLIHRYLHWRNAMKITESAYFDALIMDSTPQEARDYLPNSLKTEIVATFNMREWRWFFSKRCAKEAHPHIRALAIQALAKMRDAVPVLFDDIAEMYIPTTLVVPISEIKD